MRLYLIAPQSDSRTEYSRLAAAVDGATHVTRVASAAIATVAALAPKDFEITLCDEAVQPVAFDGDFDVIGLSANVSQAQRALAIADAFRARGKTVVMGGSHVSLAPELFEGRADSIVVGELESVADAFFSDMRGGTLRPRYVCAKADLSRSPVPRWDLYPNDLAVSGVVQTSRGCPFECHFCDVIQYLGRVQRHKEIAQVLAEIQLLYDLGHNFISLADDNFTVYRKRAKALLKAIADWNGADGRGYVTFATQMSIDVARDDEVLALCNEAGLLNAFVGIETSDEAGLIESKKRQNLKIDLQAECRKIVAAGLRIEGGLIVGFDHDDRTCFRRQLEFAMALPVGTFNVSVLVAPVATPLHETMTKAGRIVSDEVSAQFPSANLITNFRPAQMSREDLYVGTKWLINKLLDPNNFYARLEAMSALLAPPPWVRRGIGDRRRHPSRRATAALFSQVLRDLMRRDPSIGALMRRSFALMTAKPEIRDGLSDALTHYLMTLRSYELDGIYERGWAELEAPPFGTAGVDEQVGRLRVHA
jgi:radical SAM superfamily enzyme YgiQ (UPF0313 family)